MSRSSEHESVAARPALRVLHVDMDAFFASVEQRERPELAGLPVIVGADPKGGRGRGVVAACSYPARRFGIHSAMPISEAYRRCPKAVFLRPNGRLYQTVSQSVMEILRRFSDRVEPISIDEAFLDVTGTERLFGPPRVLALKIKQTILQEQRLTCSIGLAVNKFLAKVASDLEKPDGLTVVEPGREREFLAPLPVRAIWGVGPKTEQALEKLGVRRIGDISRRPLEFWRERFGKHGEHIWRLAQGLDARSVRPSHDFKSLSHERTFDQDTDDLRRIHGTVLSLCEAVAARLRKHRVAGRTVTLKCRFSDFKTVTRQRTFRQPVDDGRTLYRACTGLLESLQPFPLPVRLLGVAVGRLESPSSQPQPGLFDPQRQRRSRLDRSVDAIVKKFGGKSIRKASLLARDDDENEAFSSFLRN